MVKKSEGEEVDSQGKKISSEEAIFRYMVILRETSDYHILGILSYCIVDNSMRAVWIQRALKPILTLIYLKTSLKDMEE